MNTKQIIDRLEAFDTEVFLANPEMNRRVRIVIIGAAALLLHKCLSRATNDIDIFQFDGHLSPEILARYDMDTQSRAFSSNFSDTMEERYVRVPTNTKVFDYFIPSLEDLVISKLSSDRGKDTNDVMQPLVLEKIDLGKLNEIMSEIHLAIWGHSLSNLEYEYEIFKQRKGEFDHAKEHK